MRRPVFRTLGAIAAVALVATVVGPIGPASAAPKAGYIVETSSASATASKVSTLRAANVSVGHQFRHVFHGFSASLTDAQVSQLKADPSVEAVVPNTAVHAFGPVVDATSQQAGATWGLDRLDQRSGSDGKYAYDTTGAGVTAYVIDTGIRLDHEEFQGRATSGYDFVDNDNDASDCAANYLDDPADGKFSHGTHVAATIGGKTYGVAKQVSIVSMRVLDCNGEGSADAVIAALDWVVGHRTGPSVVNFSLGGGANPSLDAAVATTIKAGIPVVAAAGNEAEDACDTSPARVPAALTVGASDSSDHYADFSNYGTCLDLFAPGVDVLSAGTLTPTASLTLSGTSMATPHVTGEVARYLQADPKATPAQVSSTILGEATAPTKQIDPDSPNRLLFTAYATAPTGVSVSRSDSHKTVTLRWKAPASDGGYAITGYTIVRSGKDAAGHASATVDVGSGVGSYTFSKLRAGTTYSVSVRARTSRSLGVSSTSKITITALPGKPRITSAHSGSKKDKSVSVSVNWSRPKSGGPVTGYVITATRTTTGSVTTITRSSSARGAKITGLKKNKRYVLRVRAVNDSGKGSTAKWKHSVLAR